MPMRETFLPVAVPLIGDEEIQEIVKSIRSGWITTGPLTKSFEESFCNYVGARHAVAVSSCTAALHLSLLAAGVEPGDEVITTPYTFVATLNTIVHCRATPVLVDIDRQTYNLDVRQVEKKLTSRTKALVPVHFAGQPCDMDPLMKLAGERKLTIIEDAAHAAGASYKGRRIGALGAMTCFSFYAIKNMTTGEGGMVTTDNSELAEKVRLYSLHGMSRDAWKRYTSEGSWYYEILYPGFKYNMTDMQAALGLHQLARLDQFIARRTEIAQRYDRAFAECPSLITPPSADGIRHAWHLYPLLIQPERLKLTRNEFIEKLRAMNIGTTVNFIPNHLQPWYRDTYGYRKGDFPASEWVYEREISLPLFPKMSDRDAADVIEAVLTLCRQYEN
jgi:dTDP-4-amino-4,6-dideoxygalactose transaminase